LVPKKKTFGDEIKHTFDTAKEEEEEEKEGKKKDIENKRWVMEVYARLSFWVLLWHVRVSKRERF
jgi:hypothetical protein